MLHFFSNDSPAWSLRRLVQRMGGAWLEPRTGFMFQENTGLTPTTAVGQTVGLLLDQTQGLALGPELLTNGGFDSSSGWTLSANNPGIPPTITGGRLVFNSPTADYVHARFEFPTLTAGATFLVEFAYTHTSGFAQILFGGTGTGYSLIPTASGQYRLYLKSPGTNQRLEFSRAAGGNNVFEFDNVSVRQILGNHASQTTTANRPTLQQSGNQYFLRQDGTDFLSLSLPALSGGNYSTAGSVYFATPQGMSALHDQSMGTSYTLPALSTDVYGWAVFPSRLKSQDERMLEKYMLRLAGLAAPDYLLDDMGNILTDDIGDPLLAG